MKSKELKETSQIRGRKKNKGRRKKESLNEMNNVLNK